MSSASKSSIGDTPEPATSVVQSGSADSSASAPARCGERRSLSMRSSTTRFASSGANGDRSVVSGGGGGCGLGGLCRPRPSGRPASRLLLRIAALLDGPGALDRAMRRPHLDRNRRRRPGQMRAEEEEREDERVSRRRDASGAIIVARRGHHNGLHRVAARQPLATGYSDRVRPTGRVTPEFSRNPPIPRRRQSGMPRCSARVASERGGHHGREEHSEEAARRVRDHREAGPEEGGVDEARRRYVNQDHSINIYLDAMPYGRQAPDPRGRGEAALHDERDARSGDRSPRSTWARSIQ